MPSISELVNKIINEDAGDYNSYQIVKTIGRGGFSEVRLVEKRGHRYAMKVPLDAVKSSAGIEDEVTLASQSGDSVEQFKREAKIWAQITDEARDSAVGLVDFNVDPFPWMVMDLADEDLSHAMGSGEVDVRTIIDLLRSLQRIHDLGIVHRDIKPENILRVNGVWKFSDFGLSKSISSASTGSLKGTPEYMAPEQCMPRKLGPADSRTDIWQMGILAFKVITGKTPYPGADRESMPMVICMEGPDLDQVPEKYRAVIGRALSQSKDERYQSAGAFADALEDADGGKNPLVSGKNVNDALSRGISLYTGDGKRCDWKASYEILESGTGLCRVLAAYMKHLGHGTTKDEVIARLMFEDSFREPSEILDGSPESEWIYGLYLSEGFLIDRSEADAFAHFKKAAEASFVPAMSSLGYCFNFGQGVVQSYVDSVKWFWKAADQGNAFAQNGLGVCYGKGLGVSQSYEEGVKWCRKAADQGYAVAQDNLGFCYYFGQGVFQSYEDAAKWYRRAADQGHSGAQYKLGNCYHHGQGVPQSDEDAAKWYRKAADQGNADAQNNLGVCYFYGQGVPQSDEEAVKWYRKAADQGHAGAQNNLGFCYERGRGVPYSCEEAVKWYRKAADQGNADAQNNLGFCYEEGKGVPQSYEEAVKWYRKAAEQGNADAQNNLGFCYEEGKGVLQSYEEAVKWYRKAADQGNADAQNNLGFCYEEGKGVPQSYEEAANWYREAAEQGIEDAQSCLGTFYEKGLGVSQSYEEAAKWYRRAADQGNADAQNNLGLLYEYGLGVPRSSEEAAKWYRKAAEQGHKRGRSHRLFSIMPGCRQGHSVRRSVCTVTVACNDCLSRNVSISWYMIRIKGGMELTQHPEFDTCVTPAPRQAVLTGSDDPILLTGNAENREKITIDQLKLSR